METVQIDVGQVAGSTQTCADYQLNVYFSGGPGKQTLERESGLPEK